MSYLKSIGTQPAPFKYSNQELLEFMDSFVNDPIALRKLKYIWNESGIESKHSVLEDFRANSNSRLFKAGEKEPDTESRMLAFDRLALPLAKEACDKAMKNAGLMPEEVDAVISVSCTGMSAPGLEIDLADSLGLSTNVQRHAINFMGCYAAFHAMRLADLICSKGDNVNVLLVCTELCSLHFRLDGNDDNLLSTTLFADGAGAMIWSSDAAGAKAQILGFHSDLIKEGQNDMAWNIGNRGFEMVLNKNVPKHIEAGMRKSLDYTMVSMNLNRFDIDGFAIHPGGKNVLGAFASALGVENDVLKSSFEVLRNYGNMSSASIIFVLEELLAQNTVPSNIYAAAFGPGLTIESAILRTAI